MLIKFHSEKTKETILADFSTAKCHQHQQLEQQLEERKGNRF